MFKSEEIICRIPEDAEFANIFDSNIVFESQFDAGKNIKNIISLFAGKRRQSSNKHKNSQRSSGGASAGARTHPSTRSSSQAGASSRKGKDGKNIRRKNASEKNKKSILKKLIRFFIIKSQARNIFLFAAAVIILIVVICVTSVNSYKVYINNEFICAIPKAQITSDEIKSTVAAKIKEANGVNVELTDEITIKKGHSSKKEKVTNDFMLTELSNRIGYNVEAAQVAVNGQVVAVVKDIQTADDVLNGIIQKYIPEGAKIVDKEFIPKIDKTTIFVSKDQLSEPSVLQDILSKTTDTPQSYTVAAGDTLFGIAGKADMTLAQLIAANPGMTENTPLQIGQQINLIVAVPFVSVRITQEVTQTEVIKYKTQTVANNNEYKTYSKVISAGSDGEKTVTTNIVTLNGIEESRSVVSETITKEAVDEKVEVGTLETPPKRALGSFNYPASAVLTSSFGSRWGTHHDGIDLAAPYGTCVYASDGGVVKFAGYNSGGYGNLVIIDHENGYETYYAHNSKIAVSEGQHVAQGELISYVGSTGDSTGNHVHFEIRKNGVPENPLSYINN